MLNIVNRLALVLSGLILVGAGGTMLLAPEVLHAKNGVTLGNDPNLLSEIRAPGGFLFLAGLTIAASAAQDRFVCLGLGLAALVYSSFGVARVYSIFVDGFPVQSLVLVTGLELGVGTLAAILSFYSFRTDQQSNQRQQK
ncbi:DUF4345 domain-containing protein [Roseobacter sp. EG26]|uniref:DUF4345 domain-containing protein n=1 Tax=Roseobacter sp. EG26 TaxID=3412477 RepID=UPI003CE58CEA